MKPFKLMTTAALAASLFSVGSISAFAAEGEGGEYTSKGSIEFKPYTGITDPVDPTNPTDPVTPVDPGGETPELGTNGPLSIDFASSFDFGIQEISSQDQTYYAAAQLVKTANGTEKEVPNYVQVSDNRGTEAGWGLSVTQDTEFTSTSGHILEGAEIVISNVTPATATDSPSPSVTAKITLNGEGATSDVMTAANGEGAGTHLAKFGDDTTQAKSVALNVPGKITKYAESYETTLTWALTDTPANEDIEA